MVVAVGEEVVPPELALLDGFLAGARFTRLRDGAELTVQSSSSVFGRGLTCADKEETPHYGIRVCYVPVEHIF